MPLVVPKYDGGVQEQSAPNVRVNTQAPIEAFGGGDLAAAPTRALQQTAEIVDRERQKADQTRVLEADTEINNYKTNLFYDPKEGVITKRGRDAFGAQEEYAPKLKQKIDELAGKLSSPAQRQAFLERANRHQADFDNLLQKHTYAESEKYDDEVTDANLKSTQNDVVLNHQDPQAVVLGQARMQEVISQYAARRGKSPEWVKEQVESTVSKTNAAIVDRMLANGSDVEAEEFFKNNRQSFRAEDLKQVEAKVAESSLLGKAQRVSADVMSRGLTLTQAIAEANQLENPKEKAAVKEQIRMDYARRESDLDLDQKRTFQIAAKKLDASGGDLKAIAPELATLDVDQQDALKKRAQLKVSGETAVTDLKFYTELKTMASSPATQNAFLKQDPALWAHRLNPSDYKKMVDLQANIRSKGDSAASGIRSYRETLTLLAAHAGIKNTKSKEFIDLDYKADQLFNRLVEEGKNPGKKEYRQIVDDLLIETESGSFFSSNKKIFQLDENDKALIPYSRVPESEKIRIKRWLEQKGVEATDAAISKTYTARKLAGY
jgi:hypothetical protein